jgi:F1F0 ATPase subunit 2
MNETMYMILTFISGMALGIIFFGGLWLTVRKMVESTKSALWMLGSFLFRMSITLIGFYYVSQNNLQRLIICLLGFIAARFIVIYFTKSIEKKQAQFKKEVSHEA